MHYQQNQHRRYKMKALSTVIIGAGVLLAGAVQSKDVYRFGGGPSGGGWHPADK